MTKMYVALSFVGELPEYIIDVVFQTRLFFHGDIYLIASDVNSRWLSNPILKDVKIVNYTDVNSPEFDQIFHDFREHFNISNGMGYRNELFARSLERFFILQNTMRKYDLENVYFIELDNMIYCDPENLLSEFSKYELCYMVDHVDRCSSGVMYVKTADSLLPVLEFALEYILQNCKTEFINEMTMLYRYYIKTKQENLNTVQILPTFWKPVENIDRAIFPAGQHFSEYNSIFDSLPIGIFLCGVDRLHSFGKLEFGRVMNWSKIDYSKYNFIWKEDELGRKMPYIVIEDGREIKINNLHIHSKELHLAASKPLYGLDCVSGGDAAATVNENPSSG